jgi:hypothetical protein
MPQLDRVFVSHAARDKWIAERIAEALRARGARPFLDVYDIEKGDNIPEVIRKELNRARSARERDGGALRDLLNHPFPLVFWDAAVMGSWSSGPTRLFRGRGSPSCPQTDRGLQEIRGPPEAPPMFLPDLAPAE